MHFLPARSATMVVAFSLAASGILLAAVGGAHAAGTSLTQTLNVADLTPCCGNPQPNATGLAVANSLSKAGVGEAHTFNGTIIAPGVSSTAVIHMVLSRAGQDYAECALVPVPPEDDSSTNDGPPSTTFKVVIAKLVFQGVTFFKQLAGTCDVDLSTGGIQPGVPDVQTGDVATAVSIVNSVRTKFLDGSFVQP